MAEQSQTVPEEVVADGRNKNYIKCQRCSCLILNPNTALFTTIEKFLPHMKVKSENQQPEDGETLTQFWKVDDMYSFENVGFTNKVENLKFLICADCEVGPIGFHDTNNPKEFFVALDRVNNQ